MQNRPVSPADWFRSAPSFIPPEELQALKARAAARIQQEREEALQRAAELDADLRALSEDTPPPLADTVNDEVGLQATAVPHASTDQREEGGPDSSWSNKALVTFFAQRNPGARAADYMKFLVNFRPGQPEKKVQSNVYDALKVLKRDEILRADGPRGDSKYYFQGGKKPVAP
jgi:hypothetical protein